MRALRLLVCVLGSVPGCHWVLPLGGASDQQTDTTVDAPLPGEVSSSHDLTGTSEGPPSACAALPGLQVVARYDFEDASNPLADAAGAHNGVWTGTGGAQVQTVGGRQALVLNGDSGGNNCGDQPGAAGFAELPAGPHWQIPSGRISLRVRFDQDADSTTGEAILGRDQGGDVAGNLSLVRLAGNILAVRLQLGTGQAEQWHCSQPGAAPAGRWVRVVVSFGGADLLMCTDEAIAGYQGSARFSSAAPDIADCVTGPISGGIEGTDRSWAIGATNWCGTAPGQAWLPMKGAVDDLVIERAP